MNPLTVSIVLAIVLVAIADALPPGGVTAFVAISGCALVWWMMVRK